jgi:hypothetical protein
MRCQLIVSVLIWCSLAAPAAAYPVGPAISLDEMFGQAGLVCKAEVVSTKPVDDAWFEKVHSFQAVETRLAVIALYKGQPKAKEIAFRHYAEDNKGGGYHYMPQHYKFEVGRTYLMFAAKTEEEGIYRQLWKQHKSQDDQGVVLAASKEPHEGESIKEVIWRELSGLLKSEKKEDVFYGLRHLDELSGGSYIELHEFDREQVLDTVRRLITHRDQDVARVAIGVFGSRNPYMSHDFAPGWLASIGGGDIPGYGLWDPTKENLGGKLYWKQLAAVVNSDAPAKTRALAVRAMGRAHEPAMKESIRRWIDDNEPAVRQAAIVVMTDYAVQFEPELLKKLLADPEPLVRQGVAQAIGFGQFKEQASVLSALLADKDTRVARDAALSLLSLPLETSKPLLEANIDHAEYQPLFVNALAAADPAPYLPRLIEVVKQKKEPENWWGGRIPWGVSWDLLFRHAQGQTTAKLNSGELDKVLEALEYPAAGDAKGPSFYSSSEPRDLYALYKQRGMAARAKKFRATCVKNITYDIDYYFKQVDERPQTFRRE